MQIFLGFASTYSTFYGHQRFLLYEEDVDGTMVFKGIHPVNYFYQNIHRYTGALFENIDIPYPIALVVNAQIRMKYRLRQSSAHLVAEIVPHYGIGYSVQIYDQYYGLFDAYEDLLDAKLESEDVPLKESIVFHLGHSSGIISTRAVTDGILEIEYRFLNVNGMHTCFLLYFYELRFLFN